MVNSSKEFPDAGRTWPRGAAQTADPAVDAALGALATLPNTPIPDHHAVYAALHDGLLAELNADPSEER